MIELKNKSKFLYFSLIALGIIFVYYICFKSINLIKSDTDYKKLNLNLSKYDIEYYTVYDKDILGEYKVYKINDYYMKNINQNNIKNSKVWSRNKFYEYIMNEFYEYKGNRLTQIDRENLYYYNQNGIYAIFDLKNSKLYYLDKMILYMHKNYSEILDIKTDDYVKREIYSVRGGPQNDGIDYYVYQFDKRVGESIEERLKTLEGWSTEKLSDDILANLEYNDEVFLINKGYYYYGLVSRTSSEYEDYDFYKEEATGWQIGIYDTEKNVFYYCWTSY